MPSYERYETHRRQSYGVSSQRTALGYWIPLAVTVTVATAGLVAWVWNERKDDEDDEDEHNYRPSRPPHPEGPYSGPPPGQSYPPPGPEDPSTGGYPPPPRSFGPGSTYPGAPEQRSLEEEGIVSKVSGALRRTPSPQQLFDVASKRVTAGVAAAGAVVGGALASITEEEKGAYEDHSRWSEEADSQNGSRRTGPELRDAEARGSIDQGKPARKSSRKQKTVAIILSAETDHIYEEEVSHHQEHASVLSHLPEHVDEQSRLFVLIYDPTLKQHPLTSSEKPQSMASSYSNIGPEDGQSPTSTPLGSRKFNTLYTQAQAIVEKESMIMPFTTPTAFVQMLRQLSPETVYIQANLAGNHGELLDSIKGWVRQIVLVVGDESGHGGLVDSEDERGDEAQNKWWLEDSRIGLGKGIEVVEGLRIGEDWGRRIKGRD